MEPLQKCISDHIRSVFELGFDLAFFFFFSFLIHSLNSLFIFLFERKVVGLDENTLGVFCIWKSDINRNKAPTENELGHMPRRPDAVACGPGHWAEHGLAGPRTSHVSHVGV